MKPLPGLSQVVFGLLSFGLAAASGQPTDLLIPGEPLTVSGTHGKFDFLTIDASKHRLLAAHTGNATLDVFDLDRQVLIKSIQTGAAQSSAVDEKAGRYYVGVSKPPQMVILDSSKLEETGKVSLDGPADLAAFDVQSDRVYVGHDDGKEVWVVDPTKRKVAGVVALPSEAPEDLGFDSGFKRLFQSIKTSSVVTVIDLAESKVVASWPTAPAQAPHGMAMMPQDDAFLVAGGNGKLVMMSQKDGHVISSVEIPLRVDQIAYDAWLHRAYCASGTGKIAVIGVEKGVLTKLGEVASSEGCHSIALDAATHTVWIAYAKGETSFVRPFTAPK